MKKVTYIQLDGQELYELRVFVLNYSLQQMADRLNCSAPLLCRIEKGARALTPAMSMQVLELVKQKYGFSNENEADFFFIKNFLLESELRE